MPLQGTDAERRTGFANNRWRGYFENGVRPTSAALNASYRATGTISVVLIRVLWLQAGRRVWTVVQSRGLLIPDTYLAALVGDVELGSDAGRRLRPRQAFAKQWLK